MQTTFKFPLIMLFFMSLLALIGPSLVNEQPFTSTAASFLPPSVEHWLGTNHMGQDVWTQLLYGARTSLMVGLFVSLVSTFLSVALGLVAGYVPSLDRLINGLANMILVLPNILLILLLISFTGGGTVQLVVILGLLTWPAYMRIIRSAVFTLKEREFVKVSQMFGGSTFYILRHHLLKHIQPLIKTKFVMTFRYAILTEAGLSFLGLGDPNVVSWGKMLHEAFQQQTIFMNGSWTWLVLPPVMFLLITTVCLAFVMESHQKVQKKKKQMRDEEKEIHHATNDRIVCQALKVAYQEDAVLKDASFSMTKGEIVSLIGPSGAGKTTIARAMYGLLPEEYWSGHIAHFGCSIRENGFAEKYYWENCAYIYQDARAAFNPVLTIKEQFIEVGVSEQEAITALEEVSLSANMLTKYPHECSGGMLSRALIALAFIHRPAFIIADECTSALDPILKKEIVTLIENKARQYQMSVLFITHDIDVAFAISDRVLRVKEGTLQAASREENYALL
ncbi:peptide ABC transporter permease [Bacillaceae bacterium SAS-127]|nr:peptide ABC transporter permease [Bacillaceae bacterium SAS-127]